MRREKRNRTIFTLLIISLFLAGCSTLEPLNPVKILKKPFGADTVKIGMSRSEVKARWGKPDESRTVEDKEKWNGSRELWVYRANYGVIPVDCDYLSKTRYLYFDGDNLTTIEEK